MPAIGASEARLSLLVIMVTASAILNSAPPGASFQAVSFRADRATAAPFCHGVTIGGNVLTARHCLAEAVDHYLSNGRDVYLVSAGGSRRIPALAASKLYASSFSSQSSSFETDFVAFSESALSTPVPTPGITSVLASPRGIKRVVIDGGDGQRASCKIRDVCGSTLFYTCSPATDRGWSGSPIFSDEQPSRLIGIHTAAAPIVAPDGEKISQGTSLLTVLGRSSSLFGTAEEFGDAIARTRKFAHGWSKGCDALSPPVRSGSPLETRPVPREALFSAMTFWEDALLAADIERAHPELCMLSARTGWRTWQCAANPSLFADRINKMIHLPGDRLALGEAFLPAHRRRPADSAEFIAGGVSFARIAVSDKGPIITVERRIPTPFGSVYALQAIKNEVLAGGENGICSIANGNGACTLICKSAICTKADEWRVNGLLLLDSVTVLAVGRDMSAGRSYPMAKWYRREAEGWRQIAALGPQTLLIKLSASLANRRTGMQLKAPVLVFDQAVAFGSDGSAYRLAAGQPPQRLAIRRLWKIHSQDTDRDQMEDAVRDAVRLSSGYIAIAASDGAVHLLRPNAGTTLAFDGDQGLTVFDRGIWTTELAQSKDALFVRAQDGNIHYIDLRKLPSVVP